MPLQGQGFFGREADAALVRRLLPSGHVCGAFCRGQLAMSPGAPAAAQRLGAVFGFLTDSTLTD